MTIPSGKLGSLEIYLADLPPEQRYQETYKDVDPRLQFLPNDPVSLLAQFSRTAWKVNDWSGGEGNTRWSPDEDSVYNDGSGVQPVAVGQGLELGPYVLELVKASDDSSMSGTEMLYVVGPAVTGGGAIVALTRSTTTLTTWTLSTSTLKFTSKGTGTVTDDEIETAAYADNDSDEGLFIISEDAGRDLYVVTVGTGAVATHYTNIFGGNYEVEQFDGRLYGFSNDGDLDQIDETTATTKTTVYSVPRAGNFAGVGASIQDQKIVATDTGLAFMFNQSAGNGQPEIYHYNVYADAGERIDVLPPGASITSMFYAFGFVWIAYFLGLSSTLQPTYLRWVRGNQKGELRLPGRFSDLAGTCRILGAQGDQLIFLFDEALWAYDVSTGALINLGATGMVGGDYLNRAVLWKWLAAWVDPGNGEVWGADFSRYRASGTIDSGQYDMGFFDIKKTLLEFSLVTDPLPAGTSVSMSYSVDGGAFTAATGTHDTDGATEFTWTISNSTTTVVGRVFEFRLTLATTDADETPTVRSWTALAGPAESVREFILMLDASSRSGTTTNQKSATLLRELRELKEAGDLLVFKNPWTLDRRSSPALAGDVTDQYESITVRIRQLQLVDAIEEGGNRYVLVRLEQSTLVSPS